MDHGPKCKMQNYKPNNNIGEHQGNLRSGGIFLDTTSMAWSMKVE